MPRNFISVNDDLGRDFIINMTAVSYINIEQSQARPDEYNMHFGLSFMKKEVVMRHVCKEQYEIFKSLLNASESNTPTE